MTEKTHIAFIAASYALTVLSCGGVSLWAFLRLRHWEKRAKEEAREAAKQ